MNYSPDVASATIKMIFSLGFVLAIVWGLYRLAKKKLPMVNGGGKRHLIQVIENHSIGVKKHIAMVKIPGSVLVLGVGAEKISLLTQIEDPAVIQSIEAVKTPTGSVLTFKEQLRRFTPGASSKSWVSQDASVAE